MRKLTAILLLAALLLCGCGEKAEEAEQTTVSGMVVSVDGTKVELISTDALTGGNRGNREENGKMPTWPEGETMPEGGFGGKRPEGGFGGNRPEGDFTMPEGFEGFAGFGEGNTPSFGGNGMPNFGDQMPEGDFTMPEGEMPIRPEGMTGGGNRFNTENMETTTVDLAEAHISVELEDGSKAAGTMYDITMGSRLTITMEGDKAVRVVVSQNSFGGFGGQGGFGGNRGNRGEKTEGQLENS